jgi:hypothetical protein
MAGEGAVICELIDGVRLSDRTELSCTADIAYQLAATGAALAIAASLAWLAVRIARGYLGGAGRELHGLVRATAAAGLMILSAVALALAASQPVLVHTSDGAGGHLAVVVDVSDSVMRDARSFDDASAILVRTIESLATETDSTSGGTWSGSITIFAAGARLVVGDQPLKDLAHAARRLSPSGIDSQDSNAAAGLALARRQIERSGGPGLILLVSDGHWSSGDIETESLRLQRAGVPVYMLPVGSTAPGRGIIAANVGASTEPGAQATARLVVRSAGKGAPTEVMVRPDRAEVASLAAMLLPGEMAVPVRVETRFGGRGLRHIEISIRRQGTVEQVRRLFTLVKAPPRALVFGDAPWVDALNRTTLVEAVRSKPSDPLEEPEQFDVIILDGVPPEDFPEGYTERLAQAVAGAGRGLLVINGPAESDPSAETVLGRWEKTAVGPLLPVSTDLRQVVIDPPSRDVALIFDTSGSMAGWPLQAAKQAALSIVDQLRPIDRLSIIPFGVSTMLMDKLAMTESGKQRASTLIGSFTTAGGSDATSALATVRYPTSNSCAIFFFTDGAITGTSQKPGCVTVILEISDSGGANTALERLGQVVQVRQSGDGHLPKIDYLDPEVREERWRAGFFSPLPIDEQSELTPGLPVNGIAVSYPRPEAERISVHPDAPPDPVLALRDDSRGAVGAFLGDLSAAWGGQPKGLRAIQALVDRLSGWSEVERYQFDIDDRGESLELSVLVLNRPGLEVPDRLEATLSVAGAGADAILMRAVEGEPGHFTGAVALRAVETSSNGALFVREVGEGALARPQRIPVRLPNRLERGGARGGEAWQFEVNRDVLRAVSARTGGGLLEDSAVLKSPGRSPRPWREDIHTWILAFSAVCFTVGLWLGGGRR